MNGVTGVHAQRLVATVIEKEHGFVIERTVARIVKVILLSISPVTGVYPVLKLMVDGARGPNGVLASHRVVRVKQGGHVSVQIHTHKAVVNLATGAVNKSKRVTQAVVQGRVFGVNGQHGVLAARQSAPSMDHALSTDEYHSSHSHFAGRHDNKIPNNNSSRNESLRDEM
ncbi:hypothetical protein AC249_AIPGENE4748 [Exaiptasia diaphana]|nr:hypothetical protein AC249_AIPGENE4748 [Exaiptasia diaphana]